MYQLGNSASWGILAKSLCVSEFIKIKPLNNKDIHEVQEYYKALGGSTIFVEFMLDMIEKTLAEAVATQEEEAESALNSVDNPVSTQ